MTPRYIRPESQSPQDPSLVLLSSPSQISRLYRCALLISHHSGLRGPAFFFLLLFWIAGGSLTLQTSLSVAPTCTSFLLCTFLGTRLKMPEPTKKGRGADSREGISLLHVTASENDKGSKWALN